MQTPDHPEANGIFIKPNCQKDWVGQLQYRQQMEEMMGGWVAGETASVHNVGGRTVCMTFEIDTGTGRQGLQMV